MRRTTKVKNSLGSDVAFSWPDSALPNEEETTSSKAPLHVLDDSESVTSDGISCSSGSDDGSSTCDDYFGDGMDHVESDSLLLDLFSADGSLDFPQDVFEMGQKPPEVKKKTRRNSSRPEPLVSANAVMDQDCIDCFMAEYLQNPSYSHMSFAEFVKTSLDMIASFTKIKAKFSETNQKSSSHQQQMFDFSIQNWQKKVNVAFDDVVVASQSLVQRTSSEHLSYDEKESYQWDSGTIDSFDIFSEDDFPTTWC